MIKVFALVLTIAGVCMSTLFGSTKSSDDTHPTVFGYILATVVAMAYALWEVCLDFEAVVLTVCRSYIRRWHVHIMIHVLLPILLGS